jgi:nicotinamidase-related amidase
MEQCGLSVVGHELTRKFLHAPPSFSSLCASRFRRQISRVRLIMPGPSKPSGLLHGPIASNSIHLCVDMQRLFGAGTPWTVPWMEKVLPTIVRVVAEHPERTVFTRFVPVETPEQAVGAWRRYYQRWQEVTLSRMDPAFVDLAPELARYAPPAKVVDKWVYSPWTEGRLDAMLRGTDVDTILISGGETDVCVLATVMGAIDRGYRVVIIGDGMCSSADETHDALLDLYAGRFGQQIEVAPADEVLASWQAS